MVRTSLPSLLRFALAAGLGLAARPMPAGAAGPSILETRVDTMTPAEDAIPRAWLGDEISVAEAEAQHPGIDDERVARFPEAARPFGFQNARWEALKARMRPGDRIFTFASSRESWRDLAGRSGVALVRDGTVVDALVTRMN